MIIKEDKKKVKYVLLMNVALGIAGVAVLVLNYGNIGFFVLFVGLVGAFFCIKKMLFSDNFLRVDEDGFLIKSGKSEQKFNFKDIEKIGIKTIEEKKNIQVLNFTFKKNLNIEDRFNFLRFYNDKEATLPDIYEKSFYEIEKILKDKFSEFKNLSISNKSNL